MSYTPEEIKAELQKYKLPWITKIFKKYGVPFITYSFLPALILITIFGIIYNNSSYGQNEWMWTIDKVIGLFYILGFGGFALIAHFAERLTANKLRKKLGLSQEEFKTLITLYQITGM
jgi:hypothetical protein